MRAAFKSLVCIPLALAHRAALACVTCDSQTACQVHHVVQNGNHALWDGVFLAAGVLFIAIGYIMIRSDLRKEHSSGWPRQS